MSASSVRKVLVIGGSGAVGVPVVRALLEANFDVSVATRGHSDAKFPAGVKVFQTDYTEQSLLVAFEGQDAIVSTITASSGTLQKIIIDCAISSHVKIFLPSEFGVDTAKLNIQEVLPLAASKVDTVNYLKSVQNKISWASVIAGSLFDWTFDMPPGFGGWNVPARTATIFDGGDIPFEATNLPQIAKAVVAILRNPEIVENQHIYVNSFTTTQNKVVKAFEEATGDKFALTPASTDTVWKEGFEKMKRGGEEASAGRIQTIMAAFYGRGELNNYSVHPGLWNDKLGLKGENVEEVVRKIVEDKMW